MALPSDSYAYEDLDPETAETEPCTPSESRVARARAGRTAIAAAALLGAAAVAALATASLRAAAPGAIKAADGVQLSALPSGVVARELDMETPQWQITTTESPPAISQGLDDYFNSEVEGTPESSLIPAEHQRPDKENDCFENEELFGGLCYLKCSLLTNNTHPVRSSGWTCCREFPCPFEVPKHDVGICSGYSVAGDGVSCPRPPGFCLTNEEKFLGLCYKKCALITGGEYPYRITPVTCCQTRGIKCLHPKRTTWNFAHAVGGGGGDDDPLTPDHPHAPITLRRTQTSTTATLTVTPELAAPAPAPEQAPEVSQAAIQAAIPTIPAISDETPLSTTTTEGAYEGSLLEATVTTVWTFQTLSPTVTLAPFSLTT